jgi:hypothetical protein
MRSDPHDRGQLGDPDDDAAFLPALTAAGNVLRVIEPQHRLFRSPARDASDGRVDREAVGRRSVTGMTFGPTRRFWC